MTEKFFTIHVDCRHCRDKCGCCGTHSHPWWAAFDIIFGVARVVLGIAALAFAASTGPIAAQFVAVFVGVFLAIICFYGVGS